MIKAINSPVDAVMAAARQVGDGLEAEIWFSENVTDESGAPCLARDTRPQGDAGPIIIEVSTHITVDRLAVVLAHQFAHIISGSGEDHDAAWGRAYAAIHDRYEQIIQLPKDEYCKAISNGRP